MSACLARSIDTRPPPLDDFELMPFTPLTRASTDSMREVTSASMVLAELPCIEKLTVSDGRLREGASLTGRNGTSAHPTSDRTIKMTIMENDREAICQFFSSNFSAGG